MDEVRAMLLRGDLVHDVRGLLQQGAADHGGWLRENVRHALVARRQDAIAVSALTGLAPGTVRGFLNGRPSSIDNVLLMAQAVGYTLAELDRPPDEFSRDADADGYEVDGHMVGASLLAFDESRTPMAVVLLDGTIIKINRELRELLGYDEGELVGSMVSTFAATSEGDQAEQLHELTSTDALHGRVTPLRRKDGSVISAITSAIVVRDEAGQPRYVIARAAATGVAERPR